MQVENRNKQRYGRLVTQRPPIQKSHTSIEHNAEGDWPIVVPLELFSRNIRHTSCQLPPLSSIALQTQTINESRSIGHVGN